VQNYDSLRDYLRVQTRAEFSLTLIEIEDILGFALSRASHRASWWDTTRGPEQAMPQRVACLDAGYHATRLSDGQGVRFRKIKPVR
jgi:hypothetical protein